MTLDGEALIMRIAFAGPENILGQFATTCLQPFLKPCLGIGQLLFDVQSRYRIGQARAQPVAAHYPTSIQIDRSHQRFERIGQDRIATESAALEFPLPQVQRLPEIERTRLFSQRFATHQPSAQSREVAFAGLWEALVKQLGHDQTHEPVSEEFQPLIVRLTNAPMAEGLTQERGLGETVPEPGQRVSRLRC